MRAMLAMGYLFIGNQDAARVEVVEKGVELPPLNNRLLAYPPQEGPEPIEGLPNEQ